MSRSLFLSFSHFQPVVSLQVDLDSVSPPTPFRPFPSLFSFNSSTSSLATISYHALTVFPPPSPCALELHTPKMHPKPSLTPARSLPTLLAELSALINSTISLPATPPLLSSLLEQLNPIVDSLYQTRFSDYGTVVSTLQLLEAELNHTNSLVRTAGGPHMGLLQLSVREIGRRLGLVLDAWVDVPVEVKEGVEMLKAEMAGVRFEGTAKKKNAAVVADVEDLVVRIKIGDEEGVGNAGVEIGGLIEEGVLMPEDCGGLISALFGRICLVKSDCRVKILSVLRQLAGYSNENKVR